MPEPVAGWRRDTWGGDAEARDCAFRFVEGADLEQLSGGIFRRSPRAICARLTLDGILVPE